MIRQLCFALIIFLAALTLVQSGSQQTITYSCKSVSTSVCGSGTQFAVYGTFEAKVLNYTYCAPNAVTCSTPSVNLYVQSCNIDYRNNQCAPKICYMLINQNICQKTTTSCASTPYSTNYSCIDCVTKKSSSCSKCYSAVTNDPNNSTKSEQICFGANCTEGFSATTAKYQSCTTDYLGQKCTCCVQTAQVSRFCITNNDILNREELTKWYNSELKLKGVLISVILAFIMLIL